MNSNIPQNYNNGRKRKGKSKPNFSLLRSHDQSVQRIRNEKGIYFTPVNGLYDNYVENEIGLQKSLKNVKKAKNIFDGKYAILNVVNKQTGEYYNQPYFVRECDIVASSSCGKNVLNTIPRINHKKLKNEVKNNPENYNFHITHLDKFDNFIEYCFYDLDNYNNDNSIKKYNRNINYSNIFNGGNELFKFKFTSKIKDVLEGIKNKFNEYKYVDLDISFKDITLPITVTLGTKVLELDAFEVYYGNVYTKLLSLLKSYQPIIQKENVIKREEFNRTIFVLINTKVGKVHYVPQTRFTTIEAFMDSKYATQEIKKCFNRGDEFKVLEYNCRSKKQYSDLAFKSKFAKSFCKINLLKNEFDKLSLIEKFDKYTDVVWENYDNSLFIKSDINDHIDVVYSEINKYTKNIKQDAVQEITCPVQQLILNNFSDVCFKQAWHNVLLHEIVTDQKVFLEKAGLDKVLPLFSIHSQRVSKKAKRRVLLMEEHLLLANQASLSEYASINKIFQRGKNLPPVKQVGEVTSLADVNNRSQCDIPTHSAIKDEVSYAHTNEFDYLDSLVSYYENNDNCGDYYFDGWTE